MVRSNAFQSSVIPFMCLLAAASLGTTQVAMGEDVSRSTLRSYPASALITSQPLASEKRGILEQLFLPEISAPALKNRDLKLCPHTLMRQEPVDDSTKKGLAEVITAVTAEVRFRREGEKTGIEPDHFSVFVEFSPSRVFLQHLAPRFPSDGAGFTVPMAESSTRPLRLEGKFGGDVLALVPPLRECGVKSVALCPRRYTKNDELLAAPYVVDTIRPLVKLKADGLYAPPSGIVGKVMTSLLGTPGVALPTTWFSATSGNGTLSQTLEFTTPRDAHNSPQSSLPVTTLPLHLAVESRVDLGREEGSVRTVSKRLIVELSSFALSELRDLEVGTSELTVAGGTCYLLSQWSEEVM